MAAVSKQAASQKSGGQGPKGSGSRATNQRRGPAPKSSPRPPARRAGTPKILWAVVAAVVVAVVVIIVVAVSGGTPSTTGPSGLADPSVVKAVTNVPQPVLTSYGIGSGSGPAAVGQLPVPTSGQPPLTSGGKPQVLYAGAEYCPYCAAERWALVQALGRFGTFSNLGKTTSSATDTFPNTPTFSFYKSSYSSPYFVFTAVELETNTGKPLQHPSKAQQALINKYDGPPYIQGSGGSIPFVDFGNKYIQSGSNYSPGLLQGQTWATIASAMQIKSTDTGAAIDASANFLTAAICSVTNGQPANVCSQPYIAQAVAQMKTAAASSSSTGNATPGAAG